MSDAADRIRASINQLDGVECMCCGCFVGVVARFDTERGGVYLCCDCMHAGIETAEEAA